MKIYQHVTDGTVKLYELGVGDCFLYKDDVFLVLCSNSESMRILCLNTIIEIDILEDCENEDLTMDTLVLPVEVEMDIYAKGDNDNED